MRNIILFFILFIFFSCNNIYTPKPYGYLRTDFPEKKYELYNDENKTYKFELATYSKVVNKQKNWFDIITPVLNCEINLTYFKLKNNLKDHIAEASSFVEKHQVKANAIKPKYYMNEEKKVYGILYNITGNSASNAQFFLTDSTSQFIRGALYFKCTPNYDSLAPMIKFIEEDINHLIESFEWKN
jgi:gliding motility-associated lipoprotein GldD